MNYQDRQYLVGEQYASAEKLGARIALHQRFSRNPYPWTRWVFDHYVLPQHARVLEVGCGPGTLWLDNLARIPEAWDITLSDLSAGMLAEARERLPGDRFGFRVADVQALPFADGSFDAVLANYVFHHVPGRQRAFREVQRVLRPGGAFYITTMGSGHMRELFELLGRCTGTILEQLQAFTLENGASQLEPHFVDINLRLYEDALDVTQKEPLLAYIDSMLAAPVSEAALACLKRSLDEILVATGAFTIRKASGMFCARRPS